MNLSFYLFEYSRNVISRILKKLITLFMASIISDLRDVKDFFIFYTHFRVFYSQSTSAEQALKIER